MELKPHDATETDLKDALDTLQAIYTATTNGAALGALVDYRKRAIEAWNRRAESDLLAACKNELREIDQALDDPRSHNTMTMPELVRELKRENADLLAALKRLVSILSPEIHGSDGSALEQARAAIRGMK